MFNQFHYLTRYILHTFHNLIWFVSKIHIRHLLNHLQWHKLLREKQAITANKFRDFSKRKHMCAYIRCFIYFLERDKSICWAHPQYKNVHVGYRQFIGIHNTHSYMLGWIMGRTKIRFNIRAEIKNKNTFCLFVKHNISI